MATTLTSKKIKELLPQSTIAEANAITEYVESIASDLVHLSGDDGIGNLGLSGELTVNNDVYFNTNSRLSGIHIDDTTLDIELLDELGLLDENRRQVRRLAMYGDDNLCSEYGIAIGQAAIAEGKDVGDFKAQGIAIGRNAQTLGDVGAQADCQIAVGSKAKVENAGQSIAIGRSATVMSCFAATKSSKPYSTCNIAIGSVATISTDVEHAIATGYHAQVGTSADNAIAIGSDATVGLRSYNATAIGNNAKVGISANNAMQLGQGTNNEPRTLKFMDTTLVKNGKIPGDSIDANFGNMHISNLTATNLSVEKTLYFGKDNNIQGEYSTAFGISSNAYGAVSHAEGECTIAGSNSFRIWNISYDKTTKSGKLYFKSADGIEIGDRMTIVLGKNFEDSLVVKSVNKLEKYVEYSYLGSDNIENFTYGTLVDESTFNDEAGNPVTPATNMIYFEKDKVASYIYGDFGKYETLFDNDTEYESGKSQGIAIFVNKPEIGDGTISFGNNGHAEGLSSVASGLASHAEGIATKAIGKYAHAEGKNTTAGYASHAEGANTYAAKYSHAEGNETSAINTLCANETADRYPAHSEGYQTSAFNYCTNALGIKALAKDKFSYVWNAAKTDHTAYYSTATPYSSNGFGTYSINPKDGISGFYIGEKNLCAILDDVKASIETEASKEIDTEKISANAISVNVIDVTSMNVENANANNLSVQNAEVLNSFVGGNEYDMLFAASNDQNVGKNGMKREYVTSKFVVTYDDSVAQTAKWKFNLSSLQWERTASGAHKSASYEQFTTMTKGKMLNEVNPQIDSQLSSPYFYGTTMDGYIIRIDPNNSKLSSVLEVELSTIAYRYVPVENSFIWNGDNDKNKDNQFFVDSKDVTVKAGNELVLQAKDGVSGVMIGDQNGNVSSLATTIQAIADDRISTNEFDVLSANAITAIDKGSKSYFNFNTSNAGIGTGNNLLSKTSIGLGNNVRDYSVSSYEVEEDDCVLSVTYAQMLSSVTGEVGQLSDSAIFKYDHETGHWNRKLNGAAFTIDFNKFKNILTSDYSVADMTRLLYEVAINKASVSANSYGDLSAISGVRIAAGVPVSADEENPAVITYKAKALPKYKQHDRSFTWNGQPCTYHSRSAGSFSINPIGGLAGFYVGDASISTTLAASETAVKTEMTALISNVSTDFGKKLEPLKPYADGRKNCNALGVNSNAFGFNCLTEGQHSIAIGNSNTISGYGAVSDSAGAFGLSNKVISAEGSYAIGKYCEVLNGAHHSIALGANVSVRNREAFVWNGASTAKVTDPYYVSKGNGTFAINPANGISGFYIGDKNLKTVIDEYKPTDLSVMNSIAIGKYATTNMLTGYTLRTLTVNVPSAEYKIRYFIDTNTYEDNGISVGAHLRFDNPQSVIDYQAKYGFINDALFADGSKNKILIFSKPGTYTISSIAEPRYVKAKNSFLMNCAEQNICYPEADGTFTLVLKNGLSNVYIEDSTKGKPSRKSLNDLIETKVLEQTSMLSNAFESLCQICEKNNLSGIYPNGRAVSHDKTLGYDANEDSFSYALRNGNISTFRADELETITDGTDNVDSFALGSKLTSLYLPNVEKVGGFAFKKCLNMVSVYLPKCTTFTGAGRTFYLEGNAVLSSVYLPELTTSSGAIEFATSGANGSIIYMGLPKITKLDDRTLGNQNNMKVLDMSEITALPAIHLNVFNYTSGQAGYAPASLSVIVPDALVDSMKDRLQTHGRFNDCWQNVYGTNSTEGQALIDQYRPKV